MVEKEASTEARTKLLGYQLEEHAADTAMFTGQRASFQTAWEAQVNPAPPPPPRAAREGSAHNPARPLF